MPLHPIVLKAGFRQYFDRVARSGDEALFTRGERAYGPNRELDANGNGVITAAEATAHVRSRMGAGGN